MLAHIGIRAIGSETVAVVRHSSADNVPCRELPRSSGTRPIHEGNVVREIS